MIFKGTGALLLNAHDAGEFKNPSNGTQVQVLQYLPLKLRMVFTPYQLKRDTFIDQEFPSCWQVYYFYTKVTTQSVNSVFINWHRPGYLALISQWITYRAFWVFLRIGNFAGLQISQHHINHPHHLKPSTSVYQY